uniref:C2H2-type domain-containing protein n=1 Tax=Chromera velia CCMP2878 TaxID=1169474 RepID=A0A0G4GI07_9ALVE|eukprot:Cvel_21978.t1-p1 / transcript=Cvel_21978.t1 / gene=Cvel_21978 / organism=Chromera_velia_CCMP2878 / gene_product=hypothetical protein / transcript_product=hypothetical protein / location=Cvel_scaffold2115:6244-12603(+) / protein_length=870 / sequence_SO=supercontig / SO=protein_coding / is_pseudo=false
MLNPSDQLIIFFKAPSEWSNAKIRYAAGFDEKDTRSEWRVLEMQAWWDNPISFYDPKCSSTSPLERFVQKAPPWWRVTINGLRGVVCGFTDGTGWESSGNWDPPVTEWPPKGLYVLGKCTSQKEPLLLGFAVEFGGFRAEVNPEFFGSLHGGSAGANAQDDLSGQGMTLQTVGTHVPASLQQPFMVLMPMSVPGLPPFWSLRAPPFVAQDLPGHLTAVGARVPPPPPPPSHAKKRRTGRETSSPDSHFRACFIEISFSKDGGHEVSEKGPSDAASIDWQRWVGGHDLPADSLTGELQVHRMDAARKRRALLCGQLALISNFLSPDLCILEECDGPLLYRSRADRVFTKNGTLTVIIGDGRYASQEVKNRPPKNKKKPATTPPIPSTYDRTQEVREMEKSVAELVEAWQKVTTNDEGAWVDLSPDVLQAWLTKALAEVSEAERLVCFGQSRRNGCTAPVGGGASDEFALLPFLREKSPQISLSIRPLFAAKDYPNGDSSGDHPSSLDLSLDPQGHVISRVLEGELEQEASRRLNNEVFMCTLCKASCSTREKMKEHLDSAAHRLEVEAKRGRPQQQPQISPALGARLPPETASKMTQVGGFLWRPLPLSPQSSSAPSSSSPPIPAQSVCPTPVRALRMLRDEVGARGENSSHSSRSSSGNCDDSSSQSDSQRILMQMLHHRPRPKEKPFPYLFKLGPSDSHAEYVAQFPIKEKGERSCMFCGLLLRSKEREEDHRRSWWKVRSSLCFETTRFFDEERLAKRHQAPARRGEPLSLCFPPPDSQFEIFQRTNVRWKFSREKSREDLELRDLDGGGNLAMVFSYRCKECGMEMPSFAILSHAEHCKKGPGKEGVSLWCQDGVSFVRVELFPLRQ